MKRFHHRHRSRPGRCTHLAVEPLDRRAVPSRVAPVGPLPPIPDNPFAPPPEVLPVEKPDLPELLPPVMPLEPAPPFDEDGDLPPFVPPPLFVPGPEGPG
jgi:hypothetical protein